jgi:ATP-binding protein involved in chromosome partitioning
VPFLGEVPIDLAIRVGGDEGRPVVDAHPNSPQTEAFRTIASAIIDQVTVVTAAATKLTIIQ